MSIPPGKTPETSLIFFWRTTVPSWAAGRLPRQQASGIPSRRDPGEVTTELDGWMEGAPQFCPMERPRVGAARALDAVRELVRRRAEIFARGEAPASPSKSSDQRLVVAPVAGLSPAPLCVVVLAEGARRKRST